MARLPNTRIEEQLRDYIMAGRYDHLAVLPSERQLAEDLHVGRGTIRAALLRLQQSGLLSRTPGRGVRITPGVKPHRLERIMIRCSATLRRDTYELMGLLSALCLAASERFVEVVLSFAPFPGEDRGDLTERCRNGGIQGIISIESSAGFERLKQAGIPAVVVNAETPEKHVHCRADFRTAGRLAGLRLLKAGHRRIGLLSGPGTEFIYKEMLAGFRGALAEEEITLAPEHIIEMKEPDRQSCQRLRELLSQPGRPTAVFSSRDWRAQQLWQVCREMNLKIPEQLSVIGYDNISWPEAAAEGLTTIRQPVDELAHAALSLLDCYFRIGAAPEAEILEPELIDRTSIAECSERH